VHVCTCAGLCVCVCVYLGIWKCDVCVCAYLGVWECERACVGVCVCVCASACKESYVDMCKLLARL